MSLNLNITEKLFGLIADRQGVLAGFHNKCISTVCQEVNLHTCNLNGNIERMEGKDLSMFH